MSERLSLLATQIDPNSPYRKFDEGKSEAKERWVSQRYSHSGGGACMTTR